MPYIKKEDRIKFDELLDKLGSLIENSGEFNYCVTSLMQSYIQSHDLKYQYLNDLMGALEGAKLEMYRRIASEYEDEKITSNGDVMNDFILNKLGGEDGSSEN